MTGVIESIVGVGAVAYVAKKMFGPTLDSMGTDINKAYQANIAKVLNKAARKVADPDDGAIPNLRVARDVLWNGVITDDEICTEYFGGMLASSRSQDGRDDSALPYVDCIKALSSKQLHLHYVIYNSVHKLVSREGKPINPGMASELSKIPAWFATQELSESLGLNPLVDLPILMRQGLVNTYAINIHVVGEKGLSFTWASPTTFGVLLYAAAQNYLQHWRRFGSADFPESPDIALPQYYASGLEELCRMTGMPFSVPNEAPPT